MKTITVKNMKLNIKGCGNCPFMVNDVDFDKVGNEYFLYCNLLRTSGEKEIIIGCFSDEDFDWSDINNPKEPEEMSKVLDNCPLKKEEITLKLEENE